MLRNFLKIALRNLQKQKVLAFINVFGLSTGIACFVLLLLFSANELSFDKFHKNAADIYRPYIWNEAWAGNPAIGYTDYSGPTPAPLGEAMKKEIPGIQSIVRLQLPWGENLVRSGKAVLRTGLTFADPSFFSIFTFPLKYGSNAAALVHLNDIVLTESKAKQLFGTDDAVGRIIQIQIGASFQPFTVTAIAKDIPSNSTIRFDVLGNFRYASINQNSFIIGNNWHPTVVQTYIQLVHGNKLATDGDRLRRFLLHFDPNLISNMKSQGLSWKGDDLPVSLRLQPLLAIHTDSAFVGWAFTDFEKINPQVIWILLVIAAGILLIACINFTTLAIGRSAGRSKEVGVRKVIGAEKGQIIFQFLTEALLLAGISAVFGLLLAYLALPWFDQLSGRQLSFSLLFNPKTILLLTCAILAIGGLAGSYPALVLSGFKPVEVLKNKVKIGGANLFTQSLVTFQFVLSIALIVCTIIILQQTRYMLAKNPGFDKENVVAVDASETDPNKTFPVFKQAVINHPEILGAASAAAGLGAGQDFLGYTDHGLSADVNIIDPDYRKVLGMRLVAGRDLETPAAGDTLKRIIINETMMKAFGWTPQNAIGQQIKGFQGKKAVVAGVVKNFNYRPLSEGVKNQVFETTTDKGYTHFYVRIARGNPARALTLIQKAWQSAMPGIPLKYSFVDQDLSNYYTSEERWTNIVGWAGALSIFLGCLGLLGLAALAAINRTKEFGVRKILGASISNIVNLLLKDFLKLVLLAFLIASPIAWYFMSKWLQGYANHVNISWTVFLFAGLFVIAIALITISYHAIKAALMNPVKSLRSE